MIKARIAEGNNVCLVFDTAQSRTWYERGRIDATGITPFLQKLIAVGIPTNVVSAVCLADVDSKPKASDFKAKQEYLQEIFSTYAFNVVVPIGAVATEKMLGFKGASKYFGKVMVSETYPGMKLVPCPNPAAAAYNPQVIDQVNQALQTIVANMDFPEIRETEKRELTYHNVDTIEKFRAFLAEYNASSAFAFDTETSGFRFNADQLLTIQFSNQETVAHLIQTNFYSLWTAEEWEEIKQGIRELFADQTKTVIAHNLKFDMLFLHHHLQIPIRKFNTFDTMIAHFLCDETTSHSLKDLACQFTDLGDYEFELERWKKLYCKENKLKVGDFSYSLIPLNVLAYYAQADADVTFRLYNRFKDRKRTRLNSSHGKLSRMRSSA